MTETTGATCVTFPDDLSLGHVGGPFPCCEVKLVDVPDMRYLHSDRLHDGHIPCEGRGEVWVRGPGVIRGYYKDEEETEAAGLNSAGGWLKSGDIGALPANIVETLLFALSSSSNPIVSTLLDLTVLYTTLLYSTLLYSTPHYSTLLYSTLLTSTQLHSTLLYSTLLYSTLLYSTPLYSTILYSTLLYSTLLHSTLLYSTLLYSIISSSVLLLSTLP